jgi:ATP:ADP antiporter, AAA family
MFTVRTGEWPTLLWSAGYFFALLFGYYLLRPVREAMGIARGVDDLPWLMTGTLVAMLLASPVFAALVSRVPRRRFIPIKYQFFAANLLGFALLLSMTPPESRLWLGYSFYIWISVYNLFAVSIFWAVMSDIFANEQGKRLFGLIGVGGTLGAICGSTAVRWFSGGAAHGLTLEAPQLMLISVGFIQLSLFCVRQLSALPGMGTISRRDPGPGAFEGIRLLLRSRYLALIAVYMAVFAVLSTYLYLEQNRIIAEAAVGSTERRAIFATVDLYANILTIVTQLFLTGVLISRLGVAPVLALLPAVTIVGFTWMWISPSLSVLIVFQVLRRGLHHALDRPAREVLYTVVTPDARYKSKTFIDTFVYRAGDMGGVWSSALLRHAGVPLALIGGLLATVWFIVAVVLGRTQRGAATAKGESPSAAAPELSAAAAPPA